MKLSSHMEMVLTLAVFIFFLVILVAMWFYFKGPAQADVSLIVTP